ncbi:MAG: nucleotidyltransferase family protein [Treponema sp.]|jgi:CTP:molybdopterin cytidylyltransferase MocA|nr:nucleotidyltransferase family protein [Treponema sp.]
MPLQTLFRRRAGPKPVKFGAVIAAAGLSSRMGAFKPLLPLEGGTVIGRVIGALRGGGAEDIVVVTGRDAGLLEKALGAYNNLSFVHNADYAATDMFCSAVLGLEFMAGRADGVFFTPADMPFFSADTARLLAERLRRGEEHIVIPVYRGRPGHPAIMLPAAAKELIRHKNPGGLKGAIEAYGGPKCTLEVDDRGILQDLDTPEDYRKMGGIIG